MTACTSGYLPGVESGVGAEASDAPLAWLATSAHNTCAPGECHCRHWSNAGIESVGEFVEHIWQLDGDGCIGARKGSGFAFCSVARPLTPLAGFLESSGCQPRVSALRHERASVIGAGS